MSSSNHTTRLDPAFPRLGPCPPDRCPLEHVARWQAAIQAAAEFWEQIAHIEAWQRAGFKRGQGDALLN